MCIVLCDMGSSWQVLLSGFCPLAAALAANCAIAAASVCGFIPALFTRALRSLVVFCSVVMAGGAAVVQLQRFLCVVVFRSFGLFSGLGGVRPCCRVCGCAWRLMLLLMSGLGWSVTLRIVSHVLAS
jgi:hypothetical protein